MKNNNKIKKTSVSLFNIISFILYLDAVFVFECVLTRCLFLSMCEFILLMLFMLSLLLHYVSMIMMMHSHHKCYWYTIKLMPSLLPLLLRSGHLRTRTAVHHHSCTIMVQSCWEHGTQHEIHVGCVQYHIIQQLQSYVVDIASTWPASMVPLVLANI